MGGVITPTLFLGAALGSLFGIALQHVGLNSAHLPVGIFALVGMGSVFAATTRSPLLAIVMILEISLNYSIMPALMLGCAVSTLVSRRLHPNSIYTEPLKTAQPRSGKLPARRGDGTDHRRRDARAGAAGARMRDAPGNRRMVFWPTRIISCRSSMRQKRLLGVVALQDLKEYLNAGAELSAIIAYDVMRPVPAVFVAGPKTIGRAADVAGERAAECSRGQYV